MNLIHAQISADEPWTQEQLMEPSFLADLIKNKNQNQTYIYNIGPSGTIQGAIDIGATTEPQHLDQLDQSIKKLDKDAPIVVYCGCCPFNHCPNIRPAMTLLKARGYTNYSLLNLPQNLKIDWIDKGYPME